MPKIYNQELIRSKIGNVLICNVHRKIKQKKYGEALALLEAVLLKFPQKDEAKNLLLDLRDKQHILLKPAILNYLEKLDVSRENTARPTPAKFEILIQIVKNIPKLIQSSFPPSPALAPLPTRGKSSVTTVPVLEGTLGSVKLTGWVIYFPKDRLSSLVLVVKDAETQESVSDVVLNLFDAKGKKVASGKTNDEGKIVFHKQMRLGKYVVRSKKKGFIELMLEIQKPAKPRTHAL